MNPTGHLADCLHLHACYHFAPMLERAAAKGECVAEWEQELEALSAAGRAQVVCLCLCAYMHMCVCVYACMHACIYVCNHMALSAAGRAQVVCLCLCVAYLSCVHVLWPPGATADTD